MMSKKDFIALADALRGVPKFGVEAAMLEEDVADMLADFCEAQNPAFKRERWLAYLNGECGPNGGKR